MAHEQTVYVPSPQGPVTELSERASWDLLAQATFGRLGVTVGNRPDIFPVDFRVDGETIVFRTAAGTKLAHVVDNPNVVFEVDDHTGVGAWSVVANGTAHVIDDAPGRAAADLLTFPEWLPLEVYLYVRIVPTEIRGRIFAPAPGVGVGTGAGVGPV